LAYAWPGNVRELRNAIEMLCLLRAGKQVRVRDLPASVQRAAPDTGRPAELPAGAQLTVDLDQPLDRIVGRVIDSVLTLEQGNRTRAAERLGVSIRTIQRHIARVAAG
jgi:DNA-binding NtrC family response regulator